MRGECPFLMATTSAMEKYRHDTLFTKEPETIAWLEHFAPGDVFYDVGANVGVYSLYAAWLAATDRIPGLKVFAFEPVQANYLRLCENVAQNKWGGTVRAWKLAVGSFNGSTILEVPSPEVGASGAQMMGDTGEITEVATLDRLFELGLPAPQHLKIDIDGQELEVLAGAAKTLRAVKSVLIEVSTATKVAAIVAMVTAGLTGDNDFNTHVPHSRTRRRAEGIDAENWIFTRRG